MEAGSDIEEVHALDAEAEEGDREWDDDEWESVDSTPVTECDEQLGLCAPEWER